MNLLDKLLSRTTKVGDCLEWQGAFNTDGYPRIYYKGNQNGKAHRVIYELYTGEIPDVVRHKCDNIKCVNPEHLKNGSSRDNVKDRVKRGRCKGHVTEKNIREVHEARNNGLSYKEIASIFNIKEKRVGYILTLGG